MKSIQKLIISMALFGIYQTNASQKIKTAWNRYVYPILYPITPDNALLRAAERNDVSEIRRLVGNGAHVNARDNGDRGMTPLMHASFAGNIEAVAELVRLGARVNDNDFGTTALMYAVLSGKTAAIKKLVQLGADINARDNQGDTALSVAARSGKSAAIVELLRLGACPDKKFWEYAEISPTVQRAVDRYNQIAARVRKEYGKAQELLIKKSFEENAPEAQKSAEDISQIISSYPLASLEAKEKKDEEIEQ